MRISLRHAFVALAVCNMIMGCKRTTDTAEPPAGTYSPFTARLSSPGDSGVTLAAAEVDRGFFPDPQPLLGRFFLDADFESGASPTVVISHSLWTTRFRSAPELLGRTIEVDGQARSVVGVAAPGFRPAGAGELWLPRSPGGGARP